jgi:hypothetical protein
MAKYHQAVAWRWRAARPCWAACFLIELRCALWASPPSITTFVLPALLCQSVRAALLRHAQAPGRGTSPVLRKCWSVRCGADMASARLRIVLDQPSPAARPGRCVRGSCGARPLRQSYIKPHCPQCPPVSRKLLLWQPPLRALRVKATGFMQNCLRWVRSHSRRRFPVVGTPYAPPSARPCGCRGTVALVRRCALCGWSVACGQSCGVCPRPPLCFAAARHQPCALVCPSAPRGGSLARAPMLLGFATSLVAGHAWNTGATGRNGL